MDTLIANVAAAEGLAAEATNVFTITVDDDEIPADELEELLTQQQELLLLIHLLALPEALPMMQIRY